MPNSLQAIRKHMQQKATDDEPVSAGYGGEPALKWRSLELTQHAVVADMATSNMPTGSHSRQLMALFVVDCERCCAGRSTDRVRDDAYAIINNGQMLSSLILGCSRCPIPTD